MKPVMLHAVYVGALASLKGKTALIRDDPQAPATRTLAQFDDFTAARDGQCLAQGWHSFPGSDFRLATKGEK